jgi:hypothetical protein
VDIIAAPGIMRVSDWFRWRLVTGATALKLSPDCIATVISHESGFRANIKNQLGYKYGGLIGYGGKGYKDAISKSAEWQLDNQILPLYNSHRHLRGNTDCGDYALATFLPAAIGMGDDEVLGDGYHKDWTKGGPRPESTEIPCNHCPSKGALYRANYGFDRDRDGIFTVGDVKASVRRIAANAATKPRIPVPDTEPPKPRNVGSAGKTVALVLLAILGVWGGSKVLR